VIMRPTAWLRMQSEAKRSRGGISLQFRICREIFRICRESRATAFRIPNDFNRLEVTSDRSEQGAFFRIAGKSSVELRMVAGIARADKQG